MLFVGLLAVPAVSGQSSFAGGSGTEEDPYQIANVDQLQAIKKDLDAHYVLADDIDASETETWNDGKGFDPLFFEGTFDGQGYVIKNLYINRPNRDYVGLFSRIDDDALVEEVGVVDDNVTGDFVVGGLVGRNNGEVSDSYATGNVTSEGEVSGFVGVGGLVGVNQPGGRVSYSYATGDVTGYTNVGGLVGYNNGEVSYSYATGDVTGNSNVGGLVGRNGTEVSYSYATGSVSGEDREGGLVGYSDKGEVSGSFWDIEASGVDGSDGGVGKTTEEMKAKETFSDAGWNFVETWDIDEDEEINDGYPFLREQEHFTLTISLDGEGTTFPAEGTHTYEEGKEVTIEATPDDGWEFVEWSGDATGTNKEVTVVMDGNKEVTANFEEESVLPHNGEPEGGLPWIWIGVVIVIIVIIILGLVYVRFGDLIIGRRERRTGI